ncbi:MAG TPA: 3-oxoacyl-ACP reductase FabG [Burkholderiaceae bacterium]|nr:3-oxoacyl-ACP reductase FabG [Burkholderiaceae bacterium]
MNETRVFAADALRGEVALVTGASRGIGRALLESLAQAGATVVGTATSEAGAQAISLRLQELGASGCGLVLNVRDRAGCDALVDQVTSRFGKLSVLVNNAGITADMLALRMRDEDWDAVLDTNLSAAFRLARACMRGMMKAKWGRVINISSVVGSSGNAGQANYAAAKAGLEGMTRALARELGSRHITVNCVAPGFIDTDMTRALSPQLQQALLGQIPLGRLGQATEVAAAVLFLASAAGAYITGTTLHVNGGMYMG